jgi:hypothetical protein
MMTDCKVRALPKPGVESRDMIEVQDKTSAAMATASRMPTGSVPAILPCRSTAVGSVSAAAVCSVNSLLLIVVLPTAFWVAVVSAIRSLLGLETGSVAIACIVLVIAGFLTIVRASLMIDRSA